MDGADTAPLQKHQHGLRKTAAAFSTQKTGLTEKEHRRHIRQIKEAIQKSRLLSYSAWMRAEELERQINAKRENAQAAKTKRKLKPPPFRRQFQMTARSKAS